MLGANDGIVSTAGLVIGVAAATTERGAVLTAGLAGLAAGAMSMAVGEYVSVSTQRDSEKALIAKEIRELDEEPEAELAELAGIYRGKGLTPDLALQVAEQLTAHDALGAHAEAELGIDPHNYTNPWHAAWASMAAFTVGALLPLLAILLPPLAWRVPVTVVAVVLALAFTGLVSARLGSSDAEARDGARRGRWAARDGGHLRHRCARRHPARLMARLLVVQHEPDAPVAWLGEWWAELGLELDVVRGDLGHPVAERWDDVAGSPTAWSCSAGPWGPATTPSRRGSHPPARSSRMPSPGRCPRSASAWVTSSRRWRSAARSGATPRAAPSGRYRCG